MTVAGPRFARGVLPRLVAVGAGAILTVVGARLVPRRGRPARAGLRAQRPRRAGRLDRRAGARHRGRRRRVVLLRGARVRPPAGVRRRGRAHDGPGAGVVGSACCSWSWRTGACSSSGSDHGRPRIGRSALEAQVRHDVRRFCTDRRGRPRTRGSRAHVVGLGDRPRTRAGRQRGRPPRVPAGLPRRRRHGRSRRGGRGEPDRGRGVRAPGGAGRGDGRRRARLLRRTAAGSAASSPAAQGGTTVAGVAVSEHDGGRTGWSQRRRLPRVPWAATGSTRSAWTTRWSRSCSTRRARPGEAATHPERHVLTRALGTGDPPEPDYWLLPAGPATGS